MKVKQVLFLLVAFGAGNGEAIAYDKGGTKKGMMSHNATGTKKGMMSSKSNLDRSKNNKK